MKDILVIEDNPSIRDDIKTTLIFEGYHVLEAENGVKGVELALVKMPDLIISDIMMPELDGYGVLHSLQNHDITASIPFIFLTARAERENMRYGMELGADDYLMKPFTTEELLAAIDTRLKKQENIKKGSDEKLEELRGQIVHSLPHELRTPLTSIIGFSEFLAEDADSVGKDQLKEIGKSIFESANRLDRLIENYLTYAQIELLALEPDKVLLLRDSNPIDATGLIKNIAEQKADEYQRTADLSQKISKCHVQISEENFTKILQEILDNAFKFSESGTPVTITGNSKSGFYTIEITDHGRGLTGKQIKNIGVFMQFERKFYEQQGSGFGLTIAKKLINLHGGELTIESNPNEKTVVAFTLKSLH